MTLGELLSVMNNMDIHIMALDNKYHATTIYEGESRFYRMSEDEGYLKILFVAPHRYRSGTVFIMAEG